MNNNNNNIINKRRLIGILSFILCIVSVLFFFSKQNNKEQEIIISADYPKYDNAKQLIEKADTIISGYVINKEYKELDISMEDNIENEMLNPNYSEESNTIFDSDEITDDEKLAYTIFNVKITNNYKGSFKDGDIIQIKQLGGRVNNINYVNENGISLLDEHEYIFFLETYDNSPAGMINPVQSVYEYNNTLRTSKEKNILKTSKENNIILKIEDLENIQ